MNLYYIKVTFLKKYYKLEEINKTKLRGIYTRNRLKKFIYKKNTIILIKDNSQNNSDKINSLDKSKF
jgi:hypothetical protein